MSAARDAETAMVLSTYGSTMLQVQVFEQTLANLVLALEAKPGSQRGDLERTLRRIIRTSVHAFQKASASELRKRLPSSEDRELVDEVERLVKWRDLLAHRYLVQHLVVSPHRRFKSGTAEELHRLGVAFTDATGLLRSRLNEVMAGWPTGPPLGPEVRELLGRLGRSILLAEPFEPADDS